MRNRSVAYQTASAAFVLTFAACSGGGSGSSNLASYTNDPSSSATGSSYTASPLVADERRQAPFTDSNLINPWGLASGPDTFFWVANNGTGTSTVYDGTGAPQPSGNPLIVTLPLPGSDASQGTATPTGLVFSGGSGFEVTASGDSGEAQFLFATEQGTIIGWSPDVDATTGVTAVDESESQAVFKGLALASDDGNTLLYAANFLSGEIEVFDQNFDRVTMGQDAFVDPDLPSGFAPFNIQHVDDRLYVAFAEQEGDQGEEAHGEGLGYVSVFELDGTFVARVASQGPLNAPWAIVRAPDDFGPFGGALLVGNFGDGMINAYDTDSGDHLGTVSDANGDPLVIDGLWALLFGNDEMAGDSNTLYYTAGPEEETHGRFGQITAQ